MSSINAEIAKVKIGYLELDGLLGSDGNYYIAVPQLAPIFQFDLNQASRSFKTLLRKDSQFDSFEFVKLKTPLNPKAVNAISLLTFEVLLAKLDRSGNVQAQELRDQLVGVILHKVFCDAFKRKFEAEEIQEHLKNRQEAVATRKSLTRTIQDWYARNPGGTSRPMHAMISQVTNLVYQRLWGMDAKQLEDHLGCGRHESRDYLDPISLRILERAEDNLIEFICEDNLKPVDAVPLANIRSKPLPTRHEPVEN